MTGRESRDELGASLLPTTISLGTPGDASDVRVIGCRVCLGGEFGGNVDLRFDGPVALENELVRRLAVRVVGLDDDLEVLGSGVDEARLSLTFSSMELVDLGEAPRQVTLLVDGKPACELPCELVGTQPLTAERFTDPLEILGPGVGAQGAPFGPRWPRDRLLATGALGAGLATIGCLAFSLFEHGTVLAPIGFTSVFTLFAFVACVALFVAEHTEVRIDPLRGVIEELRVRGGLWGPRVIERRELSASGFDHVRIEERWRSVHERDPDEDSLWIVFLEGPVRWVGADGDVHLRGDALRVSEHGTRFSARRRAAEVARGLGLRVLDNSVSD